MKQILKITAGIILTWLILMISCKKDKDNTSNQTSQSNNKPPVSDAGLDQEITLPVDSALLNGTNSQDPDGDIKIYKWRQIAGPASSRIDDSTSVKTMVRQLVVGIYMFELEVIDSKNLSSKDVMQVKVNPLNHPPVANAGPDKSTTIVSCNSRGSVELDGSASSDPDNTVLYYVWTKISGPSTYHIQFPYMAKTNVSDLLAGQYAFELKVTDAGGLSARDTVLVNVTSATLPAENNLDITINGSFYFEDNYSDCYYCYNPCCYYDYISIEGQGIFAPLGQFNFYSYEVSDTATASNVHDTYIGLYMDNGPWISGAASINFKKLIQNGGGAFSGTITVTDGSARECNQNIFNGLQPLTITGTLNAANKTITLTIKGKIYF